MKFLIYHILKKFHLNNNGHLKNINHYQLLHQKIPEKKIKKNPTSEEYSEMLDEIDRLSEK